MQEKQDVGTIDPIDRAGDPLDHDAGRRLRLNALLPKDFRATLEGSIVRLMIIDRDHSQDRSGASRYVFSWAGGVDGSTQAGLAAGLVRATVVGDVPAPQKEDQAASIELSDPIYQNNAGYFYCHAIDTLGNKSIDYISTSLIGAGTLLDSTIPDDVQHFRVSESGEQANGTVWSAVAYSCQAPNHLGSFAGMQLFLRDYPSLGQLSEGFFHHFDGAGNGPINGKQRFAVARRIGTTAITATNGSPTITGTGFLAIAQAEDVIEIMGVRGGIDSVTDTTITLLGNWSGLDVAAHTDWIIIGRVTVYAVAISKGGTHRADIQNAPHDSILFDGELSAPVAPVITGLNRGGANVVTWPQTIGTQIKGYRVYRALGNGTAFAAAGVIGWVDQPKDMVDASLASLEFVDRNFTYYQREAGQYWTYYVVTVNERDDASDPSNDVEIASQLEPPAGQGPQNAKPALNLIWNGMLWFNANATIDATNVNQDTKMGGAVPPAGFYRWDHVEDAVPVAGFQNSTEIILPAPGATHYAATFQRFDLWQSATGHVPPTSYINVQFKARTSGGTPDGTLRVEVPQFNAANVFSDFAYVVERLSDDSILESAGFAHVNPSDLLTTHQLYNFTFHLRDDIDADHANVRIEYRDGTGPANVNITEVMVSVGPELARWTAQIVDPKVLYGAPSGGAPTPPQGFPDQDGRGGHIVDIQP